MSQIKTLHEAFVHELGDMYDGEHQFTQAMQTMMGMAKSPEVKAGLQEHLAETEKQIKNLEKAFKSVGEKAERVPCKGAAGLVNEFKSAAKEFKSPDLLDGLIVDAGAKAEHYEMASYKGLVEKAELMGHKEAAKLLEENLGMEEKFAKKLEALDKRLGKQLVKEKPELVGHKVPAK